MQQAHARHSGNVFDLAKRQGPDSARIRSRPGNIEIEQDDPTRPAQEDVGGFDITVRHADTVKVRQGLEDFRGHGHGPPAKPMRTTG
jgi:hypothetical protein